MCCCSIFDICVIEPKASKFDSLLNAKITNLIHKWCAEWSQWIVQHQTCMKLILTKRCTKHCAREIVTASKRRMIEMKKYRQKMGRMEKNKKQKALKLWYKFRKKMTGNSYLLVVTFYLFSRIQLSKYRSEKTLNPKKSLRSPTE